MDLVGSQSESQWVTDLCSDKSTYWGLHLNSIPLLEPDPVSAREFDIYNKQKAWIKSASAIKKYVHFYNWSQRWGKTQESADFDVGFIHLHPSQYVNSITSSLHPIGKMALKVPLTSPLSSSVRKSRKIIFWLKALHARVWWDCLGFLSMVDKWEVEHRGLNQPGQPY